MRTWLYNFLRQIRDKREPSREPAVFLHIQKTAGTSLVHLAARYYGQENIISHGDYVGRRPESLAGIPFVSGHFGYDYARPLIQTRKSFTFLRDPSERILSLYYFYRSQSPDIFPMYRIAHECTLSDFLIRGLEDPLVRTRIWNNQTWQLAHGYGASGNRKMRDFTPEELIELAIAHLKEFSYVGLTENYDHDANVVARILGWPSSIESVRENVNKNRNTLKNISDSERTLLNELTGLDSALYQHVRANLQPYSAWDQ